MLLWIVTIAALFGNALGNNEFSGSRCPYGWTHFDAEDTCLKAFKTRLTFSYASYECSREEGDLAMVKSEEKNKAVSDVQGNIDKIWLGIWDVSMNRTFIYVDRTQLTYTNWKQGEPNNIGGIEKCVSMYGIGSTKSQWADVDCGLQMSYVCEKPGEEPRQETTTSTTQQASGCPDDWALNEQEGMCIKVFNDQKGSFREGRQVCQSAGGDLVMVKNERQNDFVKKLLAKRVHYWIGTYSPNGDMQYSYVDETPLGQFQAFKRGEPNNRRGQEHCVEMENGKWFDKRCSKKRNFVCQK